MAFFKSSPKRRLMLSMISMPSAQTLRTRVGAIIAPSVIGIKPDLMNSYFERWCLFHTLIRVTYSCINEKEHLHRASFEAVRMVAGAPRGAEADDAGIGGAAEGSPLEGHLCGEGASPTGCGAVCALVCGVAGQSARDHRRNLAFRVGGPRFFRNPGVGHRPFGR